MPKVKNVLGHTLDQLGEGIVSGHYPAGGAIPPEPALCEALGVSRTVVREAVKSLVAKGLVSTGPKVGTRVLPADQWNWFDPQVVAWHAKGGPTHDFMRDLQELRRVVEPAAVRMAAERATAEDIAAIETAYAGMKAAIEQGGDYVRNDLAFHQGLLSASHNVMMAQTGKALAALLRMSFEISTSRVDGPATSLPLHREVLDAVIARDPDRAERAALVQIDGAREDIEAVLGSPRGKLPSLAQPPVPLKAPRGRRKPAASESAPSVRRSRPPAG